MTRNTIDRDGITSQDVRYFIFNFKLDVMTFCHSVRGHWSAESMHWLLDVVYREDHHQTLDKRAAFNLNLIRKMCLYFLKVMVFSKKDLSYRCKQRYISVHLEDYLETEVRKVISLTGYLFKADTKVQKKFDIPLDNR